MGQKQIYCSICGAPFTDSGETPSTTWLRKAILLTTAHETEKDIEIDQYYAPQNPAEGYSYGLDEDLHEASRKVIQLKASSPDGLQNFTLVESGERVLVFCNLTVFRPGRYGGSIHLAIHQNCMQIAQHFIDSVPTGSTPPKDGITSITQLWEVLYRRLYGESTPGNPGALPEPHDYFGGRMCRNIDWEADEDPECSELFEANPLEISDLTESILENLQPIPPDRLPNPTNTTNPENPPRPYNIQNLSPTCTSSHPQQHWSTHLTNHTSSPGSGTSTSPWSPKSSTPNSTISSSWSVN